MFKFVFFGKSFLIYSLLSKKIINVNKVQQLNNYVHYKKQKYYYFLNSKTNILTFIKFEVTSSLAFKLSHSILLLSLRLCKTEKNVQTRKNQLFPIIIFPSQ